MIKVVGFGALNMDKILFVNKIPGPDDEGFVNHVELHPGGSAANTMVGLSRLGIKTRCLGSVGRDTEGAAIIEGLEKEGVGTEGLVVKNGRSGTALVMVDQHGLRSILIDPGVNDSTEIDDIDPSTLESSDLVHMTSFICRNSDIPFRTQIELVESTEVPISIDPGQLYAERGIKALLPLIRRCRIFMPNEGELRLITGLGLKAGAKKIIEAGAEIVVVKRGMKGSYVTDGNLKLNVPVLGEVGLDTTGAGDAFNAGFIYGMLNDHGLKQSCQVGARVAWFSVQKPGARDGLPTLKEIKDL